MQPSGAFEVRVPDVDFWKELVPCQAACPVRTDAGRFVQLIAEGKYEESYLTARSPNPLASVCGRVCSAPCEDRCRRGAIDAPVSIRALKRFVTERFGAESPLPNAQETLFQNAPGLGNKTAWHLPVMRETRRNVARGAKVAVVGGGPAGLACAHDLAVMGYLVTVFEASGSLGGMMVHGIPEFRLARPVIDKEIGSILGLGVEVKLNSPLTAGFGLSDLRSEDFKAVFLSVGTQRGRAMSVEGSDLTGVIKAIDFLVDANYGRRVALGHRVLVIGGGFVAFDAARLALRSSLEALPPGDGALTTALDAARAALRAGVDDVRMVSLESLEEMPALRSAQGREEFEEAVREGVTFLPRRGASRFLGEAGHVRAIELIGVRRTYDENGKFSPVYDPDIQETLDADTVILAIGQQADLSFLKPEDGVELTPQRTIKVDDESLTTTAPGIFAGGDAAFGPRNLIEAVANGKRAAFSIDNYLRRVASTSEFRLSIEKIPTRSYRMPADYDRSARQAPPTTAPAARTRISEVERDYSELDARRQAERCLRCHIQTIYDTGKCVLCNRCVDVCPEHCLRIVPLDELELDAATAGRLSGFYRTNGEPVSAMIKDDEKCIRCGLCAIRCPTDAMTMEVFTYEERETVS